MKYYLHHLGDYMRDTAHLSMLEDAAYRRLLDVYYSREAPLPGSVEECCRLVRAKSKLELKSVNFILGEFFCLCEDGYRQHRADDEIRRFNAKKNKAIASAKARWSAVRFDANALRTQCEGNANQEPITIKELKPQGTSSAHADPIPYGLIVEAYNRGMTRLPKVQTLTPKRRALIRRAWQADDRFRAPEFWTAYFEACEADPFRNGTGPYHAPHENWRPSFDYLARLDVIVALVEKSALMPGH